MEKLTMKCETAQELWDFLQQYVWPVGGKVLNIDLRNSETGHAFLFVTYEVPGVGVAMGVSAAT